MTDDRSLVVAFALGAIAGAYLVSRQYRERDIHIIDRGGAAVDRESEIDTAEEQANHPGINDYVEVQAYARRQEELARKRGRKNAEAAFDKDANHN